MISSRVAAPLACACMAIAASFPGTPARAAVSPPPLASRLVLYAPSGMRPDLLERYVAEGSMPTYAQLIARGVVGVNGLVPAFPTNESVGAFTIATGTWAGEHGITDDTFHRIGESSFTNSTAAGEPGLLQADSLAAAAERAGLKVAQLEWSGGSAAGAHGPTVDGVTYFSNRGVLTYPPISSEQNGASAYGLSYQVASFVPAAGWINVPPSYSTAQEAILTVPTSSAPQNPTRTYAVYVYDSTDDATVNYDSALLVRAGSVKDGAQAAVTLDPAHRGFQPIRLQGSDGLIGARVGQTAGFYVNLLAVAPDLSSFKLYFTSIRRAVATCSTAACEALPGAGAPAVRFENYLADHLPVPIGADYAPLEAGLIDDDTYAMQALYFADVYLSAVLEYVLGTLQPDTQLALVGYPAVGDLSRQFLGLVTPTDLGGNPNPWYDDRDGNGPDLLVAYREAAIRNAYASADARLARARDLVGGSPTVIATSGHGIAPAWYAVNAAKVLVDAGLQLPEQNANCRAGTSPNYAKACWSGGTAHVYFNVTGRDSTSGGLPSAEYEARRDQVIAAFQSVQDPSNPGAQVIARILKKEELRNVDASDALHPSRSGDLVVVARPPYQFSNATRGELIAPSQFFGASGYLPELVDLAHNVDMHGVFVAGGPGIRSQAAIAGIRAIDIAPTVAFLMGFPGAQNARGRVLYPLLPVPGRFKEIAILGISDFSGQLTPLAETADSAGGINPSFTIGGAAYLKPWLDVYRGEATNGSITVAGGGSTGGSPPISSFFGDVPTIQAMNLMGFSVDALGYPNFARGQTYLRTSLIPLAQFPYVASNVVYTSTGRTPAEWTASRVFDLFGGTKLGVVGFADDDLASLIQPGYLDPFKVVPAAGAVGAEAAKLKAKKVNVVVALGYAGATGGTLDNPIGPVTSIADVPGLDAVIGDRTDFQVVATRNGVLIVENRSKGIRFTRVRLVFDTIRRTVTYKTADYHKPWNIGVTPDPTLQAQLDELATELAPILATVIGNSTVRIPRSDACGNVAGRTCESLVGDVVADAMRKTYEADFAFTNSGGFRADMTCPTTDAPGDLCPAYTPPPYPITRGQVAAVLPLGNTAVTLLVNGAELKAILENGVSRMPSADGRFPQVSGLCFTYDIAAPAGSRVTAALRQAADGSCTGPAVDLTAGSTYSIVENDYMVTGGDGYPYLLERASTRDMLDQLTADYVTASTSLSPAIQGRIACISSLGMPACPVAP